MTAEAAPRSPKTHAVLIRTRIGFLTEGVKIKSESHEPKYEKLVFRSMGSRTENQMTAEAAPRSPHTHCRPEKEMTAQAALGSLEDSRLTGE